MKTAFTPPNATASIAVKSLPVIVTSVPTAPLDGVKPPTTGATGSAGGGGGCEVVVTTSTGSFSPSFELK